MSKTLYLYAVYDQSNKEEAFFPATYSCVNNDFFFNIIAPSYIFYVSEDGGGRFCVDKNKLSKFVPYLVGYFSTSDASCTPCEHVDLTKEFVLYLENICSRRFLDVEKEDSVNE